MANRPAKTPILLFGASGHAKVILDIVAAEARHDPVFLADDDVSLHGRTLGGCRIVAGRDSIRQEARRAGVRHAIVSIGANAARRAVADWLVREGISLVTAVHPAAVIAPSATIGMGTVVMAGVVINADSSVGENSIVNTSATIDHDCRIGCVSHVAPGAHLCGNVVVGDGAFVGAGATIVPGVRVGDGALVGAGSTLLTSIPAGARVAGSPARAILSRSDT